MRVVTGSRAALTAALVVAFAVPYVWSSYSVSLIALVFIAALLAVSVNMLAGEMHLVSLGHAGIAGSASYAVAWASNHGHGYTSQLLLALGVTLVVSVVYALTSMRTGGIFFLMVTLALGMVVFGLAYRLSRITGGENGLRGIQRPSWLEESWQFYYFCLAVLLLVMAAVRMVQRSPFGLVLRGIRDSESRMSSLGYSVTSYKFTAIVMSGFVAGLVGVLAVWHAEFVSPSSAGFLRSALTVIMVILGGVGTLAGPLVGAGLVIWTENVLSTHFERWPTALGLIFIVVVLFAPKGVLGGLRDLLARYRGQTRRPRGTDLEAPTDAGGSEPERDEAVDSTSTKSGL